MNKFTRILALVLVLAMALGLAACGAAENGETVAEAVAESTEAAAEATEAAAEATEAVVYSNEQVIIGESASTTGELSTMWSTNSGDVRAAGMTRGLPVVTTDLDGKWCVDTTVVKELVETENADGSKTYTFTINDGLMFSDGSAVTAANYVFYYLFWYSDEVVTGLEAVEAPSITAQYVVGANAYLNGESDTFEGIHLIDEMTFSVTIDAQWLPYYYGKALLQSYPEYIPGWVPADVTIEETENGAKLSDNFTVEYIAETVENFRYNPTVTSGAYTFVSYDTDAAAYTLVKNENYPGNFEGQTANIETVIYKTVKTDTMLDELKTGAIDVLIQCDNGNDINAGLDMVEAGGFDYLTYFRSGYGLVAFKCNQGPTQFTAVRQAVTHLLDRDAFAQAFTGGFGSVVDGPYGLSQWMVNEYAEEIDALNSYDYSLEKAIALLVEDGWVYNEDGSDYSGEGVRYKKLDDGTLMPLVIEYLSIENNAVSDLLITSLVENPDVAAAGIKINLSAAAWSEVLSYYYDNTTENPYQMMNLSTGFSSLYNIAYMYEPGSVSNANAVLGEDGQELYDLCLAMNFVEEGDHEAYGEAWLKFIQKWNSLLPDIPLYSNEYHVFFSDRVHDFQMDGLNTNIATAILYMNIE